MLQEHERGVGGWQAESTVVSAVIQSTGVEIASMAECAEGLTVQADKMRRNIDSTGGTIFAERAMMMLGPKLGRDVAHKIVQKAARKGLREGRNLATALAEFPEVTAHLMNAELRSLELPEHYLGAAHTFREVLLADSIPETSDKE